MPSYRVTRLLFLREGRANSLTSCLLITMLIGYSRLLYQGMLWRAAGEAS